MTQRNLAKACSAYVIYLMGHFGPWELSEELVRYGFKMWTGNSDMGLKLTANNGDVIQLSLNAVLSHSDIRLTKAS
jgi:hypothetical protein